MAQEVNARPVILEQGQGAQYFAESLANIAAQKSAQQKAIIDAEKQRQKDLGEIYGVASKQLIDYYEKAAENGGRDVANAELKAKLNDLSAGLKQRSADPNMAREFAIGIVADVSQRAGKLKDFYAGVNKTIADLSAQGYDADALKKFVGMSMATNSIDKLATDPTSLITTEITNSPELYANRPVIREKANQEVDAILKNGKDIGTKLTLDPTGTKTTTLGTKGFASIFDMEVEETDPITGLKYKRPVLRSDIVNINGAGIKALPEDSYSILFESASPATKTEIVVGAVDRMKDINRKALAAAGYKDDEILKVTSKNSKEYASTVPGFIDSFDQGNIEKFKRIHAHDLVQKSGKYDEKGNSTSFGITERGDNKIKPIRNITNINTPGQAGTYVDAWKNAKSFFNEAKNFTSADGKEVYGKTLNSFPSDIVEILIKKANDVSSKKTKDEFGTEKREALKQEDLVITEDKNGNIRLKIWNTGEILPPITKEELNKAYNGEVSPKAKASAVAAAEKETKQPTKTISEDAYRKMSLTDRKKFLAEGGKYK